MKSKYSTILLGVLAIIAVGLIGSYYWNIQSQPAESNLQNVALSSTIKGCAETDKSMTTRTVGEGNEQEPKIEVIGNEVKYSRAINHLCCRKVEIQKETSGSTINIFEVWSGLGCRCICFSEIEATVSNIPSGSYIVNAYMTGTEPVLNGTKIVEGPMNKTMVITKNINI